MLCYLPAPRIWQMYNWHSNGPTRNSDGRKTIIFKTLFPLVTFKKLTRTSNSLCHTVIFPAPPQVHHSLELASQTTFQTHTIRPCKPHLISPPFSVTFQLGHQVPELLNGVSFIYSCESNCPIGTWSGPIPQLSAWISPGHKKYGFVGWQCFARNALQHQDAVRLLEPTEVQEVSVLVENVGDVIAHVVGGVG